MFILLCAAIFFELWQQTWGKDPLSAVMDRGLCIHNMLHGTP